MECCIGDGSCLLQEDLPCLYQCGDKKCKESHSDSQFCLQCLITEWKRKREDNDDDDDRRTKKAKVEVATVNHIVTPLYKMTTYTPVITNTEQSTIDVDEDEDNEEEPVADTLSDAQKQGLAYAERGDNLFITGGAGCGKSFLIKRIMQTLTENHNRSVHTTATTGGAAWQIGGVTFHRYLGCGLAEGKAEKLQENLELKNKAKCKEIKETDTLIIDEVSMMNPELFDKFNAVMQGLRKNYRAFGAIQLIVVGDFLQLPPVVDTKKKKVSTPLYRYAFQTQAWKQAQFKTINLTQNFRQSDDSRFLKFLNNARRGVLSTSDEILLKSRLCSRTDLERDDITRIFSRKVDVQNRNLQQLDKIEGYKRIYEAHFVDHTDASKAPEDNVFYKSPPVENRLELKVGALVLLCFNLDVESGLFNGTPGKVVAFSDLRTNTFKTQGRVIPKKETALSAMLLSSPQCNLLISDEKVMASEEGKDIVYTEYDRYRLPIVEFDNGQRCTIEPHTWEIFEKKTLVVTYTNLPLILRYAITTHKSQGQTLPSAMMDMNCFENGQCYTALSRVKRLEDLFLIKFSKDGLKVDPDVLKFYQSSNLL